MAERKPEDRGKGEEQNPEFERFEETLKKLLAVPKEEVDEKRAAMEREREEQAG